MRSCGCEVDGEPCIAYPRLTGGVELGDTCSSTRRRVDLGLGSGGFDVLYANLTRGLGLPADDGRARDGAPVHARADASGFAEEDGGSPSGSTTSRSSARAPQPARAGLRGARGAASRTSSWRAARFRCRSRTRCARSRPAPARYGDRRLALRGRRGPVRDDRAALTCTARAPTSWSAGSARASSARERARARRARRRRAANTAAALGGEAGAAPRVSSATCETATAVSPTTRGWRSGSASAAARLAWPAGARAAPRSRSSRWT